MKIFDDQSGKFEIGQEAEDFSINGDLCLSDLKGFPILIVFWKTL